MKSVAFKGFLELGQQLKRGFGNGAGARKVVHDLALAGDVSLPPADMPLNHLALGFTRTGHLSKSPSAKPNVSQVQGQRQRNCTVRC